MVAVAVELKARGVGQRAAPVLRLIQRSVALARQRIPLGALGSSAVVGAAVAPPMLRVPQPGAMAAIR